MQDERKAGTVAAIAPASRLLRTDGVLELADEAARPDRERRVLRVEALQAATGQRSNTRYLYNHTQHLKGALQRPRTRRTIG